MKDRKGFDQVTNKEQILARLRNAIMEKPEAMFEDIDLQSDTWNPIKEEDGNAITFVQRFIWKTSRSLANVYGNWHHKTVGSRYGAPAMRCRPYLRSMAYNIALSLTFRNGKGWRALCPATI